MFNNEPFTDFSIVDNRSKMQEAIEKVLKAAKNGLLKAYPIVDGIELATDETITREDPSDYSQQLGVVGLASVQQAELTLASLNRGAEAWAETDVQTRVTLLRQLADLIATRRFEISALVVVEAGKNWKEADADIAEAIDFCRYYASQMEQMGSPISTGKLPGEENIYFYQPRGICVVISPWNFPFAIACGMAVAGLVTGNATVLKPAEQTSLVAYEFAKLVLEAGFPPSAFAFLPGRGELVGRTLVEHPLTDMICFTGSKPVGLEIIASAAKVKTGQKNIKKVIAEMGGKNAIIIDDDADLDEAVRGVLNSAFGFGGQKCSACSRLIAVGDSYEPFLKRLIGATKDSILGDAKRAETFIGPIIDKDAYTRILDTIDCESKSSNLAFRGSAPSGGYFVAPAIFRDVAESSFLWQEEIFGPVLACRSANTFSEALKLANSSQYALTGAVFSRHPEHIMEARRGFKVGNLYINRGSTGALVGRQPFGGFKMSGVGSKAGGPDYLLQFVEPRTITENTMRRGFSPEL